jgi:GNAT superfamily N-acetyltransferase
LSVVTVRDFRHGDGQAVAQIILENGAYHAELAPDYFKQPEEDGLVDFIENDSTWREQPTNLCVIAEIDGEVAGCLEATLKPPMETARWQSQRDLSGPRLFIGFLQTAEKFRRQGVATALVEAAEQWGRGNGARVAVCDTYIDSPLSIPFWEKRMGYERRAVVLRKTL